MRMFFALWPDADLRARIAEAAAALLLPGDARRVPRENYHVTLSFVGEIAPSQHPVLQRMGRDLKGSACVFKLDGYEYWPRAQVVALVAQEIPAALTQLHAQLRLVLGPMCLLRAHITLARKVTQAPVLPAMSPIYWNARSFVLVRSDTSGEHSAYTVVDTWPLLDETPIP